MSYRAELIINECILCHLSNRFDESSPSYQFVFEWNVLLMMMTPTVICRIHSRRTLFSLFDCSNNWKNNIFITTVISFLPREYGFFCAVIIGLVDNCCCSCECWETFPLLAFGTMPTKWEIELIKHLHKLVCVLNWNSNDFSSGTIKIIIWYSFRIFWKLLKLKIILSRYIYLSEFHIVSHWENI